MSRQTVFDTPSGFQVALALRDDNSLVQKIYFQNQLVNLSDSTYRLFAADAKMIAERTLALYADA